MKLDTCLVLMFKAPQRSKRRLAAKLGAPAQIAAAHLLECAIDDLSAWPGPACLAPAEAADAEYARARGCSAQLCVLQGDGNLGERIERVNASLHAAGHESQIFIGIDCPGLDADYLRRAADALIENDVVLGPAHDGGVVLMGVRGVWPPLAGLPWSSAGLGAALQAACAQTSRSVAHLEALRDVDELTDLDDLPERIGNDPRPSRQRLREWILTERQ
jgi:hypothetical protein